MSFDRRWISTGDRKLASGCALLLEPFAGYRPRYQQLSGARFEELKMSTAAIAIPCFNEAKRIESAATAENSRQMVFNVALRLDTSASCTDTRAAGDARSG
jgi:hypothetical protein